MYRKPPGSSGSTRSHSVWSISSPCSRTTCGPDPASSYSITPAGRRTASASILPRDAVVEPAGGEEQRAAPVAVHERHALQAQRVEKIGNEPYLTGQRQIRTRVHRAAVRAEREDRADVPEALRQQRKHAIPQRVVHQQPVQQDHRRPGPGLVVIDDARRDFDVAHVRLPRTITLECSL